MNTYYLNNTGDRWVILDNDNRRVKVEVLNPETDEVIAVRRVKYFFQHGNFAGVVVSLKGKVFKTLNYRLIGE